MRPLVSDEQFTRVTGYIASCPVSVCARPFEDDDLDRIAKQANDTIYGLAASVWTRNGGTAHKLASRIRSGTVWINCHNVFDASLPFGGYKQSGWGRETGEEVFHNYTEITAVTGHCECKKRRTAKCRPLLPLDAGRGLLPS
jgi:delta 1-pyrroline-5-carboxylate dehydrogenase